MHRHRDTFGQHHMGRCRMQQPSSHNGAATIHIETLVVAVAAAQDLLQTLKKNLAEPFLCPACVMGRHQCFASHNEGGAILLMHTCLLLKQSSFLCMPCNLCGLHAGGSRHIVQGDRSHCTQVRGGGLRPVLPPQVPEDKAGGHGHPHVVRNLANVGFWRSFRMSNRQKYSATFSSLRP